MANAMIKATNNGKVNYITCPADKVEEFTKILKELNEELNPESFEVGKMPLEALPEEIQNKVKSILKAYNEANVVYEYGRFNVSASYGIKSHYNYDHFVCGYYKQDEVYTKEERKQNFIEEFGYCPAYLK